MAPIEVPMIQSGSMPGLVQRLIDAGLVGAERAAALQHQHDLPVFAVGERPSPRPIAFGIDRLRRSSSWSRADARPISALSNRRRPAAQCR